MITCYREGKLMMDAVNSAIEQSLLPIEILIVNDASTDLETIAVCKALEQTSLIRVIWRTENGGPSVAREDGFRTASGEILVPLDADDILPQNALKSIVQAFENHPSAGFVYGQYLRQDRVNAGQVVDPGDISLQSMLRARRFSLSTNWRLIGTTPLKRSLWQSIGGYDPSFGADDLHDVEFWIRAIASGCTYHRIPNVIYNWRKYLGSNSKRVTPLAWYRIAQKYFSIYQEIGLEHRAYELLLLGSKWLNNFEEIQVYSRALRRFILQGKFQLSTIISLAVPTRLLQFLASQAQNKR
ncbi:glycosyltransferase family 2 protein [Tumidithrix helvetica]|uniref:glycosyltransferase family 2 protein n=1 Tax=Tumidithrix helvetica TaxID=3457545 RepID=UPI003CC5ACFD